MLSRSDAAPRCSAPSRIPTISAEGLGLFRIVFALALFIIFCRQDFLGRTQTTPPVEWRPNGIATLAPFRICAEQPHLGRAAHVALLAATGCFALGLMTRTAAWVITASFLVCLGVDLQTRSACHDLAILVPVLASLGVGRWADAYALDLVWARRRHRTALHTVPPSAQPATYGVSLWMIMLAVGLAYAAAAYAKLRYCGLDWIFDGVVRNHLIEDFFAKGGVNPHGWRSDVLPWIATSPFVGVILGLFTIVFEFGFVGVVFLRHDWQRLLVGAAGISFHAGLYCCMSVFWPAWWAIYLVFLPWESWAHRLRQFQTTSDAVSMERLAA